MRGRWPPEPTELADPVVQTKIAYHHGLMHMSDEVANRASLEHLVSLLHSRGVEVIIVTPPVWPSYAALIRQDYWQRAQADFRALADWSGSVLYRIRLTFPVTGPILLVPFRRRHHRSERVCAMAAGCGV